MKHIILIVALTCTTGTASANSWNDFWYCMGALTMTDRQEYCGTHTQPSIIKT